MHCSWNMWEHLWLLDSQTLSPPRNGFSQSLHNGRCATVVVTVEGAVPLLGKRILALNMRCSNLGGERPLVIDVATASSFLPSWILLPEDEFPVSRSVPSKASLFVLDSVTSSSLSSASNVFKVWESKRVQLAAIYSRCGSCNSKTRQKLTFTRRLFLRSISSSGFSLEAANSPPRRSETGGRGAGYSNRHN